MARFEKRTLRLKPNHTWHCSPGHCLCVIHRGLMQFEYPQKWITKPGETSIKLHDRTPPDDDMVLEVSVIPIPAIPERVPLAKMLQDAILNTRHRLIEEADLRTLDRPDCLVVWTEYRNMETDPKDGAIREAVWRQAFCQMFRAVCVLTFGFWTEVYDRADPVWLHTIQSIRQCEVKDPTLGPHLH